MTKFLLSFAALALTATAAQAGVSGSGGVSGSSGNSGSSGGLGIDFFASNVPGENCKLGCGLADALEAAFQGKPATGGTKTK